MDLPIHKLTASQRGAFATWLRALPDNDGSADYQHAISRTDIRSLMRWCALYRAQQDAVALGGPDDLVERCKRTIPVVYAIITNRFNAFLGEDDGA